MSVETKLYKPKTGSLDWSHRLPALGTLLFGLVLASAVLGPTIFSPWHHSAFELPKAMISRGLAGLAFLLLALMPGARRVKSWGRHPLVVPLLITAAVLIAATLVSIDPRLSLWGSYERQYGLLTWLAPLILFGAALVVLQNPARQGQLFRVLIWTSAPILAYGLLQALGADPFAWDSDGASAVLGTLGRSNFLGAYLVLVIPLTGAGLLLAVRRWPLTLLLSVQLLVLALTRARAAWLGLLGAALAFGFLWLLVKRRQRLAVRLALLLLASFIILLAIANLLGLPAELTESGSTAARLAIWRATAPLLAARPLLGYGPDTMQLAFQSVFPPELIYYQGRHLAVDRAHSFWLDNGMSAGLLGLAAFIFLFWRAGRLMWRGLRSNQERRRSIMLIGIAAAISGHLIELQVSFETVGTTVLFWLVLALGVAVASPASPHSVEQRASSRLRLTKSFPLALAFVALLAMVTARPLLADRAYRLGQQSYSNGAAGLSYFVEAKRQWPVEPLYGLALAQAFWADSQPAAAASEAVSAAQLRPADARLWAAAGDILARWGATDPAKYSQALAAYRRALDLSPNTAAYHTALGLVLADSGRLAEGIAAIEQAVALDATDAVAYGHLSHLYDAAGQREQAEWAAAQARRWSENPAGINP